MPNDSTYGQHDEMAFIQGLGSWARIGSRNREHALRGYLTALDTRTDWFPGANVEALRERALSLLAREHSRAA